MRVLLVDADLNERPRALSSIATRRGHTTHVVTDVTEARRVARDETFDLLIFADVPGAEERGSARDLLVDLRTRNASLCALVLTDTRANNGIERLLDAGFDDYDALGSVDRLDARFRVIERAYEQRAAERRSRDVVEAILDVSGSLIIVLDREARVVRFNRACEEFSGLKASEVIGSRRWIDLLEEHERDGVLAHVASLTAGQLPGEYENNWRSVDGKVYRIAWKNTGITDADGKVRYVIGTGIDVTTRAAALSALRESESTLRAFYDGAPMRMALVERRAEDIVLVSCNTAMARMFDRHPEEISGSTLRSLGVDPELITEWSEHLDAVLRERRPVRFEFHRGEGSSSRWFNTSVSAVNYDEISPQRFCVVIENVTERIRLQSRLVLADRLVSVGTLAAGVAHEINNPLMYVMANLEFVLRELVAAPSVRTGDAATSRARLVRAIEQAREGADRVRQIVKNLRTFSRGEEDRRAAITVRDVLESSLDMAWNEIRHRAQLVRDYQAVTPVVANQARLGQVFLNLLVNAAQAIPEGQVDRQVIRVSTRMSGSRVVVEVSDTGHGIPKEIVGRIFDPFFTTKRVGEGTGLGLSICQGIITGLGGEIVVESEPGRGSTFRVFLPAATTPAPNPQVRTPTPTATPGVRARVLIVDDEANLRVSLAQILAAEHDVQETPSGHEVIRRVRAGERYDVIFCDLMMPEMSGVDVYNAVCDEAPEQAQRMVFLTGGAFTPRAQEFFERVPNLRLEKPFEIDDLFVVIRKVMGRNGAPPS